MGVAVYLWLDDSVERAPWLSHAEREILVQNLRDEAAGVEHPSVFAALANPFVVLLAGLYFCDVMGLYAIGFWLPQLIRTMGYLLHTMRQYRQLMQTVYWQQLTMHF